MIEITTNPTHLTLKAPFHPNLSALARNLNGRWKGQESGWLFALDQEAALRALCLRLWGGGRHAGGRRGNGRSASDGR